jgi:MoaA/NifB/PqqE/SkfB family radical SAM enzyme
MFTIPIVNQLSYRSIPRNKELNLNIENHCDFPSRVLVVDWQGNCFVCACEAWLPITVGNITDFNELTDIWNSSVATALQADIDQKKFTFCAVDRCGILNQNMTAAGYAGHNNNPNIYYISINIDESCNLHCPSCRKETVMYNSGPEYETKLAQVNHLVDLLKRCDSPMHVIMSGNGDPLASNILRPLLHHWQPKKDQTIRLFTNGLLLEKQLTNNKIVDNITQYFISIDAGSAEIYEQVRAPGRFDILTKNFDFLRQLVDQTKATVLLKFVLQQTNYNDMQNFVDLCEKYQFNGVINRLEDWGTWDEYAQHDVVGNVDHPLHDMTIDNLKKIYAQNYPFLEFNSSLKELAK